MSSRKPTPKPKAKKAEEPIEVYAEKLLRSRNRWQARAKFLEREILALNRRLQNYDITVDNLKRTIASLGPADDAAHFGLSLAGLDANLQAFLFDITPTEAFSRISRGSGLAIAANSQWAEPQLLERMASADKRRVDRLVSVKLLRAWRVLAESIGKGFRRSDQVGALIAGFDVGTVPDED